MVRTSWENARRKNYETKTKFPRDRQFQDVPLYASFEWNTSGRTTPARKSDTAVLTIIYESKINLNTYTERFNFKQSYTYVSFSKSRMLLKEGCSEIRTLSMHKVCYYEVGRPPRWDKRKLSKRKCGSSSRYMGHLFIYFTCCKFATFVRYWLFMRRVAWLACISQTLTYDFILLSLTAYYKYCRPAWNRALPGTKRKKKISMNIWSFR